jgi:MFS family permease
MKAIGLTEFGGPEVLKVVDLPEPEPGPGEVRIRVHAVAVSPPDSTFRSGGRAAQLADRAAPYIPGMDAAGVVGKLGEDSDGRLAVGDRVIAYVIPFGPHGGSYAEKVVVAAASVVPAPAGAFPEASTLLLNATTARLSRTPSRCRALSIALASGAVAGQLAGGLLVSADIADSSWRPVFLVNVPICAGVLAAGLRLLPRDEQRTASQLDLAGVAALSATLLLLVVSLTVGRSAGWPAWTWACLIASLPASWAFLASQRRTTATGGKPLLDVRAVSRPPVLHGLLSLLSATSTYYALLFTLAQCYQQGLGRGPLTSGLILLPWVAAFGVAGQVTQRISGRYGPVLPAASYALLTAAYLATSAALVTGRPGAAVFAVLFAIGGFALGAGFATLVGHVTNSVPASYAPNISGVTTTTLQIGGAIGVRLRRHLPRPRLPRRGQRHPRPRRHHAGPGSHHTARHSHRLPGHPHRTSPGAPEAPAGHTAGQDKAPRSSQSGIRANPAAVRPDRGEAATRAQLRPGRSFHSASSSSARVTAPHPTAARPSRRRRGPALPPRPPARPTSSPAVAGNRGDWRPSRGWIAEGEPRVCRRRRGHIHEPERLCRPAAPAVRSWPDRRCVPLTAAYDSGCDHLCRGVHR